MEHSVDVSHKRNAVVRKAQNELLQRVVVQTDSGEQNDINVQIEFPSDALNGGRLSGSRSSILWYEMANKLIEE